MYNLGIDVQKKQSIFHVVNDEGRKIDSGRVDTTAASFAQLAKKQARDEGVQVALETGNMSFQLSRAMINVGADVFVVDAFQNALIAKSTKKTDKQDAKMLANQRRLNMLPPNRVYVPSVRAEKLRHLVSHRASMIKRRTQLSNRAIRFGERFSHTENRSAYSSKAAWTRLQKVTSTCSVSNLIVGQLAKEALLVQKNILFVETAISDFVDKHFSECGELLRTIPGIGLITSSSLIAQVEDINRFQSARQLCRYLGLTPVVRESGGKRSGRGICKSGNARLRGYFTQSALHYLRCAMEDDPLFMWYTALKKRKGWKKARIALARKLVAIAYGVWKHQQPYDTKKAAAVSGI